MGRPRTSRHGREFDGADENVPTSPGAVCPECDRPTHLMKDGRLMPHGPRPDGCPGQRTHPPTDERIPVPHRHRRSFDNPIQECKHCGRPAIKGGEVCVRHGGQMRHVREAYKRREVERVSKEKAEALVERDWPDRLPAARLDPLGELEKIATEITVWHDQLKQQVDGLNGLLTYWTDNEFRDQDGEVIRTESVENVRAIVAAYERSLDRTAKVMGNIVKLDIAQRQLAIDEAKATLIVTAVRAGIAKYGLTGNTAQGVVLAVADELEKLG